jgi:hypothetical protein
VVRPLTPTLEGFSFGAWSWSITAARRIIGARAIQPIPITQYGPLIALGAIEISRTYAARVSLDEPLIAIHTPGGVFPIDGWHRIARALTEGIRQLPARILSEAEAASIRWPRKDDE